MRIVSGTRLGRYEIRTKIGEGGMGEVYLASDTQLDRKVAVKILPPQVAANHDRMRRFTQEAKAAAALNHPNIAHIYEIGADGGVDFIAMEFIDGITLREKIYHKRADLGKLLRDLQHVAEALAKAHACGIVHRDLKPENIMVTCDGHAKILDFGLAKLVGPQALERDEDLSEADTAMLRHHSQPGMVLGTVGYMSPEQAQGMVDAIDHRSDIFSFGCLLFEAITKQKPFAAESAIKSLHKLVYEPTPLIKDLNPAAPADLQRIVRRCLAKDPDERYQTIKDVALELKEVRGEMADATEIDGSVPPLHIEKSLSAQEEHDSAGILTSQASRSSVEYLVTEIKRHKTSAIVGSAALVLTLAGLGFALYSFLARKPVSRRGSATLKTAPFTSFPGTKGQPAFSPDGRQIAFVWDGEKQDNMDIYVKLIGEGSPLRLTTDPHDDHDPTWSPDGHYLAFIRQLETERFLITIPALGGTERKLLSSPELRSADWSPDGKHLAVADSESPGELPSIYLVSPENGEKKRLTATPAQFNGDRSPNVSPDGQWVAFIRSSNFAVEDVYIVPITGGEPRRLTNDGRELGGVSWTADGNEIVFSSKRGGNYGLWRISLDGSAPEALPGAGEGAQQPAIARRGDYLAYVQDRADTNIWRAPGPNATDKSAAPTRLIASTRGDGSPRYSPDARKIAFASDRTGGTEVWVCDSDGQNQVQLTNFGGHAGAPRWSPDGKQIVLDARAEGSSDIYVVGAEGGSPRRITSELSAEILPVWSQDARWIYFGSDRTGDWQIWRMPATGGPATQITKGGGYGPAQAIDKFIYYTKTSGGVVAKKSNEPGVWRVPLEGGEEVRVFDQGFPGTLSVIVEGVAFFNNASMPNPTYDFYSFSSHQKISLLSIERSKSAGFGGRLSLSLDGKWLIYCRTDQNENDIMLVENFR